MGVLNVTPDSFSDGNLDPAAALTRAREMVDEGADLIDVGGESTRPGSLPVSEEEQISRTVAVVRAISEELGVPISIDTTRSAVAAAALAAGASIVNDVSAGRDDPDMFRLVAGVGANLVLMHMRGTPATMQLDPTYTDVVAEVSSFLADRAAVAEAAGVVGDKIWIDPGLGFGKTVTHNLQLLAGLATLVSSGRPVLVGSSRKGFIGSVTGEHPAARRLFGTAATVACAASAGAAVVRVHDVGEMARTLKMARAIRDARPDISPPPGRPI